MSETTSGESTSIYPFAPLQFERLEPEEALRRSRAFLESMRGRRSIRAFSPEPVPFELIENAIATAATAPSPDCRVPVLSKKSLDEVMIVK